MSFEKDDRGDRVLRLAVGVDVFESTEVPPPIRAEGAALGRRVAKASREAAPFRGQIDEVQVWHRTLDEAELRQEGAYRLVGNEPGLAAYWRFDEGAGTTLHDQTDRAAHGTLVGTARWVSSEANVGDHPGIRRTSFGFEGRRVASAPAAQLYFEQEMRPTGHDARLKPVKQTARVLLAVATERDETSEKRDLAVLDFAVTRDGRLAQCPTTST